MQNLMIHQADVWRPTFAQGTGQHITGYTLTYEDVPCFVQPMSVKEMFYYEQRGQEGVGSLYTTATDLTFSRNDIFEVNSVQYHVIGVKHALVTGPYQELTVEWYPESAQKRLDREEYE